MPGPAEPEPIRDVGPYRLLSLLEWRDDLVVCAAVHRQLGVERLVKVVLPGPLRGRVARRFVRHARRLAGVAHPAVAATFEAGPLPSGAAFAAVESVAGEPVDQWLRRAGSLGGQPHVAAGLVGVVAEACEQLARAGVVHGDLRAGNLRLLPGGDGARFTIKLMASEEAPLRSLQQGWRRGAPDVRGDIHALGGLFLELLSGSATGTGTAGLPPSVAPEVRRVLERMGAPEPDRRYRSMEEVVAALELILHRHRSRFGELLASATKPVVAGPATPAHELDELAPALAGDPTETWLAAISETLRRRGLAVRERLRRHLMGHRREHEEAPGSPTILVAEDDDDTREALVELLEDQGYRVIAARHGLEAHRYLQDGRRAQCMLLDLWMPEMDGWTLAAEMREGRVPAVPTIVMTAAEPHWGYPGPVVVRKPFDSRQLLGLVRTISAPAVPAPAPEAS